MKSNDRIKHSTELLFHHLQAIEELNVSFDDLSSEFEKLSTKEGGSLSNFTEFSYYDFGWGYPSGAQFFA